MNKALTKLRRLGRAATIKRRKPAYIWTWKAAGRYGRDAAEGLPPVSAARVFSRSFAWLAFSGALLVCRPMLHADDGGGFVVGPTVTRVGAKRAAIVWVTPSDADAGQVRIKTEAGEEIQRLRAATMTPKFQDQDVDGDLDHLQQLVNVEGLAPYTRYRYHVESGGGSARSGHFITAREPGSEAPFNFAIISDAHGIHEMAGALGARQPDFVVLTGDFTGGRGRSWNSWLTYFHSARPYLESSVLWPVTGNHDISPARNFRALFGLNEPDADPRKEENTPSYYSFTFGNLLYLVLDIYYDFDSQIEWVERELAGSDAKWRFVSLHDSFFTVGARGGLLTNARYRDLVDLFEKYHVDIVAFGHDHVYERSLPIGPPDGSPVHYITVSGDSPRATRPSPIVSGGIGQFDNCYLYFEIEGDRLNMEARRSDGTVMDRMKLVKDGDGRYQRDVMERAVTMDRALEIAHIYTGRKGSTRRSDIQGEFDGFPVRGERVGVTLDVQGFPAGSELLILARNDPDHWETRRQTKRIAGDFVVVEVTAPENLIYSGYEKRQSRQGFQGLLDPDLEIKANVRIDGREFEPVTLRPTLGPKSRALLTPENIRAELGKEHINFSRDLVPARGLGLAETPAFTGGFRSQRAEQRFYTWIDAPGDELEFNLDGGASQMNLYRIHGAEDEHHVMSAPVENDNGRAGVTLSSDSKGLHGIHYDYRGAYVLNWDPGLPLTLAAAPDNPLTDLTTWDLVFYVPAGTKTVTGHACSRRGAIHDPNGNVVLDLTRRSGYFSIPVATGQDRAIWTLRGYHGEKIYFLNVPPYLARSANELLLPREVVEKDAMAETGREIRIRLKNPLTEAQSDLWGAWCFRPDPEFKGRQEGWYKTDDDSREWTPIRVPARWAETDAAQYFLGYGWYRTSFKIPEGCEGTTMALRFEGVDEQAWVFVNGKEVGEHTKASEQLLMGHLWDQPFTVFIEPDGLKADEPNTLVVLVYGSVGQAGIWQPVRAHFFAE